MTATLSRPIHSVVVGDTEAPVRVVFLHGLFGRGKNFTTIAAGLAPEAQCLLVDLPNHGESGWTEHFSYEDMADLVAEHLRSGFAKDGPVDVLGHSMGGKVAMLLALRHPDLVRRLVVVDISPVSSASSPSEFEHLLGSLRALDLGAIASRLDAHAGLKAAIANDTVRGFLLQNLMREGAGFAWQPNLSMLHAELREVLDFPEVTQPPFTGPVLWVRGERSAYVKDEDAPAMRSLFSKVRRMTVRGAGHWVHSEKPDEVIAALRAFLLSPSPTNGAQS